MMPFLTKKTGVAAEANAFVQGLGATAGTTGLSSKRRNGLEGGRIQTIE